MAILSLQQALQAHQKGELATAAAAYQQLLRAQPRNADLHSLLGQALLAQGQVDAALSHSESAIRLDPDAPLLRVHHAVILLARKQAAAAKETCTIGLRQAGDDRYRIALLANRGTACRLLGDAPGAIADYEAALAIQPDQPEVRLNLALCHELRGDLAAAWAALRDICARHPDFAAGFANACSIGEKLGHYPAALADGQRAVTLAPQSAHAWHCLGVVQNRLLDDAGAAHSYEKALQLGRQTADLWDNYGQTLNFLDRLPEAEAALRRCAVLAGENPDAGAPYGPRQWHLALVELAQGKYATGFARYAARFAAVPAMRRPEWPVPLWQGEALAGKTLLLRAEQGLGDSIMLLRFLPLLREQGAKIWLQAQAPLLPLLQDWPELERLLPYADASLWPWAGGPAPDYFAQLFDLPAHLGITLDTLPATTPYLPVPAPADLGAGPCVGLLWAGNRNHRHDQRRSIERDLLVPLLDVPGIRFFSLQHDADPTLADWLTARGVTNLAPDIRNLADTARLLARLDLLISVDTGPAHLAGALHRPCWTLVAYGADWRWLRGRADSPWYPSLRLFRQPALHDWAGCIAHVRAALAEWAGARHAAGDA